MADLTLARLKQLLRYDPEIGTWMRLVSQGGMLAGSEAGYLKKGHRSCDLYRYIGVDGRYYFSARLAVFYMKGRWPEHQVDHRDLDSTNDRWNNLREATQGQNQANKPTQRNNTSGYRGVWRRRRDGTFTATITRNRQRKFLGGFSTAEAAHAAYMAAAAAVDGEFLRAA